MLKAAKDCVGILEFDALIKVWIADRHCPFALVDWLLEQGLENQAEVARWCVDTPERFIYNYANSLYTTEKSRVYPGPFEGKWRWFCYAGEQDHTLDIQGCDCIPSKWWAKLGRYRHSTERVENLLIALLDANES